jgi:hypothetical protein
VSIVACVVCDGRPRIGITATRYGRRAQSVHALQKMYDARGASAGRSARELVCDRIFFFALGVQ